MLVCTRKRASYLREYELTVAFDAQVADVVLDRALNASKECRIFGRIVGLLSWHVVRARPNDFAVWRK